MTFPLSSTFTDSTARLCGEEQKLVKTTIFDLQVDIANPGLYFYKLYFARDKRFLYAPRSDDNPSIIRNIYWHRRSYLEVPI
jgi:hypothetical protein